MESFNSDNLINLPIGVFDSGLGGISVLKKLVQIMPEEDFIYFGDSINAPYGVRPTEEVRNLTIANINTLLDMGVKAICVACNTATSAAVRTLRQMYPHLPLVGIEPAIKPASTFMEHPRVLVMATPMTIREEKFQSLLARYDDMADIIQLPCPGLMEFVEEGILSGPRLDSFLHQLLDDYSNDSLDAVVLGCTHYPFVSHQIQKTLGKNVTVFDGSLGTAKELMRRLKESSLLKDKSSSKGKISFINSDPSHIPLSKKLFEM